jgi:hypothetical protein
MTEAERCLYEMHEFDTVAFALMRSKGYTTTDDLTDADIADINRYCGIAVAAQQPVLIEVAE